MKIFHAMLVVSMSLGAAACGGSDVTEPSGGRDADSSAETVVVEATDFAYGPADIEVQAPAARSRCGTGATPSTT